MQLVNRVSARKIFDQSLLSFVIFGKQSFSDEKKELKTFFPLFGNVIVND